jgi:hypothetical protein
MAFRLEATVATLALAAMTLTLVYPEWIERLLGFDPDHGSGLLEWGISIALGALALAVLMGIMARRQFVSSST